MIVKCPRCGRKGEYPPGMGRCDCGAEFFVADDATDRTLPPRDPHHVPDYDPDTDRTLPPRTSHYDTAKANELGLYDMSGNVWEWCLDWYEDGYARDPEFLKGNDGSGFVVRGGSWGSLVRRCRSASRGGNYPGARGTDLGVRVALVQDK